MVAASLTAGQLYFCARCAQKLQPHAAVLCVKAQPGAVDEYVVGGQRYRVGGPAGSAPASSEAAPQRTWHSPSLATRGLSSRTS